MAWRNLALATISFTLSFAAWGLISAFAPSFRAELGLTAQATAFLVAVPVLLGAVARLPLGLLTDRFGGRIVFPLLFVWVAVASIVVPTAASYEALVAFAFLLGLAGSSFAVGVGFVSRWFPPEQQGTALGIYGLGNMGHSAAVFGGPVVAAWLGRDAVFYGLGVLSLAWAVVFYAAARNAPVLKPPATFAAALRVLATERLAWVLSAFYFLTFGGFVAFSVYLPTLLRDEFALTLTDAGFRTAGFVVLATLMRPLGGMLSDQIGGARVLSGVFAGIVPFALLLMWPSMVPFTVGALGCAALLGVGNGAVFKLVPQFFPHTTATVTGLVGAMGGLGGFFPPLVLGFFRDQLGTVWPGFRPAGADGGAPVGRQRPRLPAAAACGGARRRAGRSLAARRAAARRGLGHDGDGSPRRRDRRRLAQPPELRPPARHLHLRGDFRDVGHRVPLRGLAQQAADAAVLRSDLRADQGRRHRARPGDRGAVLRQPHHHPAVHRPALALRWWMHQLIFWGCILAVAITFPLVFGWIHFGTLPDDQMMYVTYIFGFPVASFRLQTVMSWFIFHGLDISAVLVLAGITLALWRRLRDRGALSLQDFSADFLPLILLFAISVTGLALTASSMWMRGAFYGFLAILHAITVIGALLYLPFGKFFHIFQRPAQLGVKLYQDAGARDPGVACARCGARFASQMQIEDLERVLPALGFDYRIDGPARTWQRLCPPASGRRWPVRR
jgi:MFS transporter, NNP family, nitrate/nitrite transporter